MNLIRRNMLRPWRAFLLPALLALPAAADPGPSLVKAQAAVVASFLTHQPGQSYADASVDLPSAPASFQAVLSGIRDVQEGCALPCTSDADIAAYGARIDSLAGELGLSADVAALHRNYMPGGVPRKKTPGQPDPSAVSRMLHRKALAPKASDGISARAQAMATSLAGNKDFQTDGAVSASDPTGRAPAAAGGARPQAASRRVVPSPAPPAPQPERKGWLSRLKNWALTAGRNEVIWHTLSPLRGGAEGTLTLLHMTGLSGLVESAIYAAMLPVEVALGRTAAHYVDPVSKERMAVDGLVQDGTIQSGDLTRIYEGWAGRRSLEASQGWKHEPDQPAAADAQNQKVVSLEAVKAASIDQNFQEYLFHLQQYNTQAVHEEAVMEKAGTGYEFKVLENAAKAHELPTKDSAAKSQEYEAHIYNGKSAPMAMLALEAFGSVAMNLIPGVSEFCMLRSEVQLLRDPTLTRDEKVLQTMKNTACTVSMISAIAMPNVYIGIGSWVAQQVIYVGRALWYGHQQKQCDQGQCDGAPELAPANA